MRLRACVLLGALCGVLAAAGAAAQSTQSTDTIAGRWIFKMGALTKLLVLNVDDQKVTGSLASPDGTNADKVEGEYASGKLRFTVKAEAMNRDGSDAGRVAVKYEGQLLKDGSLAGTASIEGFDSVKNWTATRAK